jgi:DNA-binding MarR family transcriptional regulator
VIQPCPCSDRLTSASIGLCNYRCVQATSQPSPASAAFAGQEPDDLIDSVLGASRALVAVAARSLATVAEDVTLAQYRVLVVLASRGPQRLADLADALAVDRSTATRMCDRLVRKHLVTRRRISQDRRVVRVSLSAGGAELVAEVSRRRRAEIKRIVERMPARHRPSVVKALRAFAQAAGEVPERDWSLGWTPSDEP